MFWSNMNCEHIWATIYPKKRKPNRLGIQFQFFFGYTWKPNYAVILQNRMPVLNTLQYFGSSLSRALHFHLSFIYHDYRHQPSFRAITFCPLFRLIGYV